MIIPANHIILNQIVKQLKFVNVKLYNLNYNFTFNFKAIFLPIKES